MIEQQKTPIEDGDDDDENLNDVQKNKNNSMMSLLLLQLVACVECGWYPTVRGTTAVLRC